MRIWLFGAGLLLGIVPLSCGGDSEPTEDPGSDAGAAGATSADPEPTAGAGGAGNDTGGAGGAPAGLAGQPSTGGAEGGAAGAPGVQHPAPPNVVFATSRQYLLKDLGGLEGADAACNGLAADAGLEGKFVAWLSTSEIDAKDRLGDASGWVNTRGEPFALTASELLDRFAVYYPIRYDEKGEPANGGYIATGTSAEGTKDENCLDWTSDASSDLVRAGNPTAASPYWTAEFTDFGCDGGYRLYCFQTEHQAELHPTPTQGRTVFVSSTTFTPGPGGIGSADALCAADAEANDLKGTFVALLPPSALSRLIDPGRPWVRPDGMVVADSTPALVTGPLEVAISQTADGTYLAAEPVFGTDDWESFGSYYSCADWTNPEGTANWGFVGLTDKYWHDTDYGHCGGARLICVQR